jgi:hypothetical protein
MGMKSYRFWTIGSMPRFVHHLLSSNSGRLPFFSGAGDTPTPAGRRVRVWGWGEGRRGVGGGGRGGLPRGLEGWPWAAEDRQWAVDFGGRRGGGGAAGAAEMEEGGGPASVAGAKQE